MKTLKASTLVLDFDLYPRPQVDGKNVSDMVEALTAGAELPPVVICKKTKRVADGFHRVKAHVRLYGPDARIPVTERTYKDDVALLTDAIRLNASHGKRLSTIERVRCVHLGKQFGMTVEAVAEALSMPTDTLESLAVDRTATFGKQEIVLKPAMRHKSGGRLTKAEHKANAKLNANGPRYFAERLVDLIEANAIDEDDEGLAKALDRLRNALAAVHA